MDSCPWFGQATCWPARDGSWHPPLFPYDPYGASHPLLCSNSSQEARPDCAKARETGLAHGEQSGAGSDVLCPESCVSSFFFQGGKPRGFCCDLPHFRPPALAIPLTLGFPFFPERMFFARAVQGM